jgi:15-cis-phytoene synthase
VDVTLAYRSCERVTRARAGNFYYGIRLLPPRKRRALCGVYAFARRVDDIGDGGLSTEEKLARLEEARRSLDMIDPGAPDPVLAALADVRARFSIPMDAFVDLIDGVEMDVRGTRYARFDELVQYCRRVAGSIGRLSVAVFEAADPATAERLADDLGVAMQLTNILRDIREDTKAGRSYVPQEEIEHFGWGPDPERAPMDALVALVRFQATRAVDWFARGLTLLSLLDARSAACVGAMTGIYQRILERIQRHPHEVLLGRVSLPVWEKAWVAARSLAGVRDPVEALA